MRDFLKSERFGAWAMLAPYLFGLLALVLVPGGITFGLALFDYDLIQSPQWAWLDNFKELIDDEIFRRHPQLPRLRRVRGAAPDHGRALPRVAAAQALSRGGHVPDVRVLADDHSRRRVRAPVAVAVQSVLRPINIFLGWIGLNPQLWLTDPNAAQAAVIIMSLFVIGEGFIVLLRDRMSIPPEPVRARGENAKSLMSSGG